MKHNHGMFMAWRLALLLCALFAPATIAAQGSQSGGAATARDVRLVIETSRATYRAGDSVSVRLRFANDARAPITFVQYPPWAEARLTITDASGRVLAPISGPSDAYLVSSHPETLPGGGTRVRTWANMEWFDLRHWGYAPLGPGRYTIVGAPLVVVPGASPDSTPRSNRVTITIAP